MLPISASSEHFRQLFFPGGSSAQWNSWKWQLQNTLTSSSELNRVFNLRPTEKAALERNRPIMPVSITPYYASIVLSSAADQGLRKTVIPTEREFVVHNEESQDPLREEEQSPTTAIIHRYPDRLVFLTTQRCPVYCRYCTRSRLVGKAASKITKNDWKNGLEYIATQKQVREVILSGGDPLFLDSSRLEFLLKEIRKIPHIDIIRLSTKIPVVLPQRITSQLVNILKKYQPIYINLHIIHPDELSLESESVIDKMVDGGMVLSSQTVLLQGVNAELPIQKRLMEGLLRRRTRPYALYQCDLAQGSAQFRTSIETGLDLISGLRRCTSGHAVPQYIADPPGGKVSLHPNNIISKNANGYYLSNWEGKNVFYPDLQTV